MDAKEALKVYFGYDSYKLGQREIIDAILAEKDVLAIMPTGAGKSVCYQVPAMLLPGITIVISPLISLMQDQVKALNGAGIHAGYINSSLTETQISKVYSRTISGAFKILYVAPERLENYGFIDFVSKIDISMVTVDEAHCISQWGQDFRPSYLKIVDFIDSLRKRPVVSAFTATATENVKNDISCVLKLVDPKIVVTGFDRENLYFDVETVKKKDDYVLEYVQKHPNDSGIIYCATRKNVDALYELLSGAGVLAARYHAGMNNEERKGSQNDFIYDRVSVIVATNAFGMGIDKPDVRFVIHYNMPKNMESYYQEAGRAGRDGEKADCYLLYSPQDVHTNRFFIENNRENEELSDTELEVVMEKDRERLKKMVFYCHTKYCYRKYMLNYFGEQADSFCGTCGNCIKKIEAEQHQEKQDKYFGRINDRAAIRQLVPAGGKVKRASENAELYDQLRLLRNRLAKEMEVPAYVIFTDKTLKEMSMYLPSSREELLEISGVGQAKYDKFGQVFMETINKYADSHEISQKPASAKAKIVFR